MTGDSYRAERAYLAGAGTGTETPVLAPAGQTNQGLKRGYAGKCCAVPRLPATKHTAPAYLRLAERDMSANSSNARNANAL